MLKLIRKWQIVLTFKAILRKEKNSDIVTSIQNDNRKYFSPLKSNKFNKMSGKVIK